MINQPLPHNNDIEKSVLGCLVVNKADYVVKLTENDFSNQTNQLIYKAIRYLSDKKKPVDTVSVAEVLSKKLENAITVMAEYASVPASTENIEYYIQELKDYTLRREIIRNAREAESIAFSKEYDNSVDLKSDILQKFDIEVYNSKKQDNSLAAIMESVMLDIENKMNAKNEDKLFTGFHDLDKITAGLHPEELTIVAARPGVGKTAFALQLMIQLAKKGNHCLLVSREMSTMQIGKRILSNLGRIDGHKLRFCKALDDTDMTQISEALCQVDKMPIEINDSIGTIQEIRAYCRELKTKEKLDLLIVDYLQLCKTMKKCESRRLEIDDISRQLKEISLEFHIPVVALSQLSREAVGANEPELNHLKESGAIEQDADNVIFLHVPKDTDETQDAFDIKIIMAKQRNGPTGSIWLRYARKTFTFYNQYRG